MRRKHQPIFRITRASKDWISTSATALAKLGLYSWAREVQNLLETGSTPVRTMCGRPVVEHRPQLGWHRRRREARAVAEVATKTRRVGFLQRDPQQHWSKSTVSDQRCVIRRAKPGCFHIKLFCGFSRPQGMLSLAQQRNTFKQKATILLPSKIRCWSVGRNPGRPRTYRLDLPRPSNFLDLPK